MKLKYMKLKYIDSEDEYCEEYTAVLDDEDNFICGILARRKQLAHELVRRWNLVEAMGDSSRPLNQKGSPS